MHFINFPSLMSCVRSGCSALNSLNNLSLASSVNRVGTSPNLTSFIISSNNPYSAISVSFRIKQACFPCTPDNEITFNSDSRKKARVILDESCLLASFCAGSYKIGGYCYSRLILLFLRVDINLRIKLYLDGAASTGFSRAGRHAKSTISFLHINAARRVNA